MRWVLILTGFLGTLHARAETSLGYRGYAGHRRPNQNALFEDRTPSARSDLLQHLRFVFEESGVRVHLNGELSLEQDQSTQGALRIEELFYEGAVGGLDFTIGKKVIGMGVGFAFRPLDVLQLEDRRRVLPTDVEGVPLLGLHYFQDVRAVSFYYANRLEGGDGTFRVGPDQVALKYYQLVGDWDLHGILDWHEDRGVGLGAGALAVVDDALEAHASGLVRTRCERVVNSLLEEGPPRLLAQEDPYRIEATRGCTRLLAGVVVTTSARFSFILEAWHDGSGYSMADWRRLRTLARKQRDFLGAPGIPEDAVRQNLRANQRFFNQRSLLKNNLLGRIGYQSDPLDGAVDVLMTPEDQGVVLTGSVTWRPWPALALSGAVRWFTGRVGSAYREMMDGVTVHLGVEFDHVF